jgi:SCAMP family
MILSCTVLLSLTLILVSTGSAGIIQTIQRFSHGALVAGVLGIIATIGWAIQGLGNAFYYRQVNPSQSCHRTAIHSETDLDTSQRCWSHNGKGKLRCNS